MADKVAQGIAAKLYVTEPDPAELEAGRRLMLELLDLYITAAEQHVEFHAAHELPEFEEKARDRLALATATRQRFEEGTL